MKLRKYALCVLLVLSLTGCAAHSAVEGTDINIIDAGGVTPITGGAVLATTQGGSVIVTIPQEEPELSLPTMEATSEATSAVTTAATTTSAAVTTTASTTTSAATTTTSAATTAAATTTSATTTTAVTATTTTSAKTTATTTATTTTVTTTTAAPQPPVTGSGSAALNYDEVKGVWMSYLEYSDMLTGKSEYTFRENISDAFDNMLSLGLNTVYVHARSHGDAYYESDLFPWSRYAAGSFDTDPGFDPMQIMVEEAHERDISIHAWINPLRLCSSSDMKYYGNYKVKEWHKGTSTNGRYVVEVGNMYYLNPAYPEVIDLICDGVTEIIANYDVDGIHIDDYFYPTTDEYFDSAAFSLSDYSLLSDFRFDNCDRLVESLYDTVKAADPSAVFSVSVQGSIENNYNQLYADVEKWCGMSGYLDYIVPQIYYGFDNSTQPYSECLQRWEEMCLAGGTPLVVGLSVSKIGYQDIWAGEGEYEWMDDRAILARQLTEAMECRSYGGVCLYSYRSIYNADGGVEEQVWDEIEEFTSVLG